jgi:hypothetical protein
LYAPKRLQVSGSHILDAVQCVLIGLKTERLQTEYRLIRTQMMRQRSVAQNVATCRMNTEQRAPRPGGADRNQRRP